MIANKRTSTHQAYLLPAAFVALVGSVLFCTANCRGPSPKINLKEHERSVFSQNGEDGVIEKIFSVIQPTRLFAVEFGAGDGVENSNVRNLIVNHGWHSFMIEGDKNLADACSKNYRNFPKAKCLNAWVYPGNIEILFEENGVPEDLDFLVIDIDSNDWYVWRAIRDYRPKVVQIEYNGLFAPPQKMVVDFHPMNYWDHSIYYGASIQSLYELGKKKGYELVYANQQGVNLYFVDKQYFERFGILDNSPVALYHPHKGRYSIPPEEMHTIMNDKGDPLKPNDKDLIWDQLRIKKKFITTR